MDRRNFLGALLALPLVKETPPQLRLTRNGEQWTIHGARRVGGFIPCSEPVNSCQWITSTLCEGEVACLIPWQCEIV